ncbi:phosphotransferase [Candidatus Wolfebacteria bacterium]|nr:phosphotransferase [Candidatus Wolfebacteria bacterium]
MNNIIFTKEINKNYPELNIIKIKKLRSAGMMNNIFIAENRFNKYIIKVYKRNNIKKIISEHKLLALISTSIPESISYINNASNKTYTFSNKLKNYFGVYKYTEGESLNQPRKVSLRQISKIANTLQKFQVLLRDVKNINKGVIHRNIGEEFRNNVKNLKRVVKVLKNKKKLNSKEKVIQEVLSKKLKSISEDDINNIKFISQSSAGIIHGDFAPSNLIFNKKSIKRVLDWENSCIYNYVWEIFRSMCYCSNENHLGIICSKLNEKKMSAFLKSYFSSKNIFKKRDVKALKLMSKYYYFLDPYIITSYCLQKNKRAGDLISTKINDHFWLENHQERFINLVNKYAK